MGHVITTPVDQGPNTVLQQCPNNNKQQIQECAKQQKAQQHAGNQQQNEKQHAGNQQQKGKQDGGNQQQKGKQKQKHKHKQCAQQPQQQVVQLRQTPTERSMAAQCRRTLSVHDPNTPKGQMAALEKILQKEIDKLGSYRDARTSRADVKESIARIVHILRQRMRILRRWRNGSVDCDAADLEEMTEFLTNTRIDVFAIEVQCIQDDLTRIDEYILILDAGANDLRQNVDEDFASVLADLTRFQLTEDVGSAGKFADDLDARLSDVNDAVLFL